MRDGECTSSLVLLLASCSLLVNSSSATAPGGV